MYYPTESGPVPITEMGWGNTLYMASRRAHFDPTIVWGTSVEMDELERFLAEQAREAQLLISPAHVLLRAVAETIKRHPAFNRRFIGGNVYRYKNVNLVMPMLQTRNGEVELVFLRKAEQLTLRDIAERLWNEAREKALRTATEKRRHSQRSAFGKLCVEFARRARLRWIQTMLSFAFAWTNRSRLPSSFYSEEFNGGVALVNYFGFPGAPPMVSYKASRLPTNGMAINVTMGATEPRAVVVDNQVVIRRVAPVFVRIDHRLVDGRQTAAFVGTLRSLLSNPSSLAEQSDSDQASLSQPDPAASPVALRQCA